MPVYRVLSFETDQSLVFVFTVGFSTCSLLALGMGAKFHQIVTDRKGKVMFSEVFVCPQGGLHPEVPLDGDPPQ